MGMAAYGAIMVYGACMTSIAAQDAGWAQHQHHGSWAKKKLMIIED